MNRVKILLVEGHRVWIPQKRELLVMGQEYEFPATQYWLRRLEDGSIRLATQPEQAAAPMMAVMESPKPSRKKNSQDKNLEVKE